MHCDREGDLSSKRDERLREVVELCSFVVDECSEDGEGEEDSVDVRFRRSQEKALKMLRARAEAHTRAVHVLELASDEFDRELSRLCSADGKSSFQRRQPLRGRPVGSEAHAKHPGDPVQHRVGARAQTGSLDVHGERASPRRALCASRKCELITPCAHVLLRLASSGRGRVRCVGSPFADASRPWARGRLRDQVGGDEDSLVSILSDEPILLFVQWKTMMRNARLPQTGGCASVRPRWKHGAEIYGSRGIRARWHAVRASKIRSRDCTSHTPATSSSPMPSWGARTA